MSNYYDEDYVSGLGQGHLGEYLRKDPEGKTGWHKNVYALPWAYRVMYKSPDWGMYLSPYGFGNNSYANGIRMGQTVRSGDEDEDYDYVEGEWADDVVDPYQDDYSSDDPQPLAEKILDKWGQIPDEDKKGAGAGYLLAGLSKGLAGDTGGHGKGGVVIDPFQGDTKRVVLWNRGPHQGYSVIGVPHGLYSIMQRSDFERGPWAEKAIREFLQSPYYKEAAARLGKNADDADALGMVKGIYPFIADDVARELAPHIGDKELMSRLRDKLKDRWLQGYIPSPNFFNETGNWWNDWMHDNLVHKLRSTLLDTSRGGNNDFRLLQVAVPLDALVTNEDVRQGLHSGQRDYMNELVAMEYTPFNDLGGAAELVRSDGPFVNYERLRRGGASGEEAWHDALGDRFGYLQYLLSDKDKKNVLRDLRGDIENHRRQENIVDALMRGPGQ